VQEAIQELGYSRNEHARVLRQNRASRMLRLVTRDVSNPFYSAIARGVEEEVRDRALLVIAGSSDEDAEREASAARGPVRAPGGRLDRRADGIRPTASWP